MCFTFSPLVLVLLIVTTVVRATVPPAAADVDAEVAASKEQVVGLAASSSPSLNDFGVWSKYHKETGRLDNILGKCYECIRDRALSGDSEPKFQILFSDFFSF